jgi:hypothetical protein
VQMLEQLTETTIVQDVFASGLARIEDVGGGCMRFTLYAWQKSMLYTDERREKVVVARIIMPAHAVKDAAMASLLALEGAEGAVGDVKLDRYAGH